MGHSQSNFLVWIMLVNPSWMIWNLNAAGAVKSPLELSRQTPAADSETAIKANGWCALAT